MTPWRAVHTQLHKANRRHSQRVFASEYPRAGLQNPSFSGRCSETDSRSGRDRFHVFWQEWQRQVPCPPSTFRSEWCWACHLIPLSVNFVICKRGLGTSTYLVDRADETGQCVCVIWWILPRFFFFLRKAIFFFEFEISFFVWNLEEPAIFFTWLSFCLCLGMLWKYTILLVFICLSKVYYLYEMSQWH